MWRPKFHNIGVANTRRGTSQESRNLSRGKKGEVLSDEQALIAISVCSGCSMAVEALTAISMYNGCSFAVGSLIQPRISRKILFIADRQRIDS